jgi:hypothetical protein
MRRGIFLRAADDWPTTTGGEQTEARKDAQKEQG